MKELPKKFEGQFECLRENTEKYITFSLPVKKELDNDKTITYKLKFIDSFRFMSNSLSSLVDNLSEGLHNKKCRNCNSCLEYIYFIYKCIDCNKNCKLHFNKYLVNRFANTYEFCNKDINKFILFLRKAVYPYEYMDSWERCDETVLPNKEVFIII